MDAAQLSKDELVELLHKKDEALEQQNQKIEQLEEKLRFLLQRRFAPQSEQTSSEQLELFAPEEPASENGETNEADDEPITITYTRKKRGKRSQCDPNLERRRVEHTLSENDCQCGCGGRLEKIGEVTCEQYDIIPARYIVVEHVRHKYACHSCQSNVKLASKPAQPIEKANAGPGLLAHITTAKFVDGMPLNRQEKQHERGGIHIPRNTMARWLIQLAELVVPLLNLLEDAIRAGPYIQCDESPLKVLKEDGRKATSLSYVWVRRGGARGKGVILFTYAPSRSSKVAFELFEGYHGYLQCDGYSGYTPLETAGLTLVGCMAHARRKFNDALKAIPSKDKAGKSKAATALKFIKRLYTIEREIKHESDAERYRVRQAQAVPILGDFREWLDQHANAVLPKSLLGEAIHYSINQWQRLIRYCDDGCLEIDNNSDERAIKPYAMGRRAWLFADTPEGAHTIARFFSLIETCKLHGHEPYAYLRHNFKELPKADSIEAYEALLPWNLDPESLKQAAREV